MAIGFILIASISIVCGGLWWQLVVCPEYNQILVLYHLAPQKLGLLESKFFIFHCFISAAFIIIPKLVIFAHDYMNNLSMLQILVRPLLGLAHVYDPSRGYAYAVRCRRLARHGS